MQKIDKDVADKMIELIRNIVREEISKYMNQSNQSLERFKHCIVVNDGGILKDDKGTVKDLGTGEIIKDVLNKSGDDIDNGSTVRVYETTGNYNNKYIGLNFG